MNTVGFIGTGIMGKPMARNLMKAGFNVHIYARSKEKVSDLIEEGAVFHDTVADIAGSVEALITIVGFPKDVEDIYLGEGMIIDSAKEGTYLIDMTTTSPALDIRIGEEAKKRGLRMLDAPVTGGDVGAINGTLAILVGGEREDFDACHDIFAAMGTNISYMGSLGSGQHTKMANQIVIAGTISGVSEAFAYAEKKGIDKQALFDAISTGAASSMQMNTNGKKIVAGDNSPGFKIKHFVKDMKIAKDEADASGLSLSVLNCALQNYLGIETEHAEDGTQALITHYIS